MPSLKNQHFVPRAHMKPFSLKQEGKAINVLICENGGAVENAPVKSQCSRSYLHGEDGELEKLLGQLEGVYAQICRRITANTFPPDVLLFLRDFSYLQYSRTETAMRRYALAQAGALDIAFRSRPQKRPAPLSERQLIITSLQLFLDTKRLISDLNVVLVQNRTDIDFVTSDDPTTILNRYHNARLNTAAFGIGSAGTMLMMPLSRKQAILTYDKGVYRIDGRMGLTVDAKLRRDNAIMNSAHFIKNSACVVFSDWEDRASLQQQLNDLKEFRRPESRTFEMAYAGAQNGVEAYRIAAGVAQEGPQRSLILNRNQHPRLREWMSFLKFRSKIRDHYNGSGIGHVRDPALLRTGRRRPVPF